MLFDLDGVLLDSAAVILEALRHTLENHAGRSPSDDEILAVWGRPLVDQFRVLGGGHDPEELARLYLDRYLARQKTVARPFPGITEVLSSLKGAGVPMGIVTSKKRAAARQAVEAFGFQVGALVCLEDVERPKPAPDGILRALQLLGIHPSNAVMVGDNPSDIEAGKAAGTATAGALWGTMFQKALFAAEPDFVLASPAEVYTLVGPAG